MTTKSSTRRVFLKTTMKMAAGAAAISAMTLDHCAHASGSDIIRFGLIGCGGRGAGAAINAMNADPGVRLAAMTDLFANRAQEKRTILKAEKPDQVVVDDDHCFSGLAGYRQLIDCVDVV